MVKSTKNYYNKYYRRKRIKALSTLHFAKLSTGTTIEYTGSNIRFSVNNGNSYSVSDAIQACLDFKNYRTIFLSMKLQGICIQVTPIVPVGGFLGSAATIGCITTEDDIGFSNIIESDQSLVLPYTNFSSKYFKVNFAWTPSDDTSAIGGRFALATEGSASSGVMRWAVKFIFYITYKTSA